MEYNARVSDLPMLVILFFFVIPYDAFWHVRWICFFIILILFFVKYKLTIDVDTISYSILLSNKSIYTKQITGELIKKVVFKRGGWASKFAYIKTIRGFNIRLIGFKPDQIYDDLIEFCERNQVDYVKTKDFKLVERMALSKAAREK